MPHTTVPSDYKKIGELIAKKVGQIDVTRSVIYQQECRVPPGKGGARIYGFLVENVQKPGYHVLVRIEVVQERQILDDIRLYIFDDKNLDLYHKKLEREATATLFSTRISLGPTPLLARKVVRGDFTFKPPYNGRYHVVLDNRHSIRTSKLVKMEISESWHKATLGPAGEPVTAEPLPTPMEIYRSLGIHPVIKGASESLFESGHCAPAIFEAYKALCNYVKKRSGIERDGQALMAEVFDERNPILQLNALRSKSDKDEQAGFKFLFMGAMVGIRNLHAHEDVVQKDPYLTLEYLAFASILAKRVEESTKKGEQS